MLERDATGGGLIEHLAGELRTGDPIRRTWLIVNLTGVLQIAAVQLSFEYQRAVARPTEAQTGREPGRSTPHNNDVVVERHQ